MSAGQILEVGAGPGIGVFGMRTPSQWFREWLPPHPTTAVGAASALGLCPSDSLFIYFLCFPSDSLNVSFSTSFSIHNICPCVFLLGYVSY